MYATVTYEYGSFSPFLTSYDRSAAEEQRRALRSASFCLNVDGGEKVIQRCLNTLLPDARQNKTDLKLAQHVISLFLIGS